MIVCLSLLLGTEEGRLKNERNGFEKERIGYLRIQATNLKRIRFWRPESLKMVSFKCGEKGK